MADGQSEFIDQDMEEPSQDSQTIIPQSGPIRQVNPRLFLSDDFTKWLESYDGKIFDMAQNFRGKYVQYDEKGRAYYADSQEKVMNEKGIACVCGYLADIASHNTFMSSLSEDRAMKICLHLSLTLADQLFYDMDNYALHPSKYRYVMAKARNVIEFAVRRPIGRGEAKNLWGSESTHRIENKNSSEMRGGGNGGIRGWLGI